MIQLCQECRKDYKIALSLASTCMGHTIPSPWVPIWWNTHSNSYVMKHSITTNWKDCPAGWRSCHSEKAMWLGLQGGNPRSLRMTPTGSQQENRNFSQTIARTWIQQSTCMDLEEDLKPWLRLLPWFWACETLVGLSPNSWPPETAIINGCCFKP
jgi:hypothetical protein